MDSSIRKADFNDIPVLQELIGSSVRELSRDYYTRGQIESALKYIFGVDTQLLVDGTYYVAEAGGGSLPVEAGAGAILSMAGTIISRRPIRCWTPRRMPPVSALFLYGRNGREKGSRGR